MDYTLYKTEDFVTDEYFIQWVKNPTVESNAFWSAWQSQHPGRERIVKEARQIVLMLDFRESKAPDGKFLEIWGNIVEAEDRKVLEISSYNDEKDRRHRINWWYKLAAACFIVGAMLVYTLLNREQTVTIQTAFGESRTLFLPDSTKVTLNANSVLRYAKNFNEKSREVWLDGEAFFSVVHKKDNRNFRVHTEELQVEVLGTRFNVNSRRGKSKVVLEEGKVKLDIEDGAKRSEMVMAPGELVEVSKETRQVEKKKVEVSNYSSWRMNKLVFVSMSLEEIAHLLEDNYGYEVKFTQESLKDLRFTGSASVDNLGELLQKLCKVFDLEIIQEGKLLTVDTGH